VGRALYTSSNGSPEGLDVWIGFTTQSDHYTREDCEAIWESFAADEHITYKTIAWYAKHDNPEAYKAWHDSWCREALDKAMALDHVPVAEYIYRLYWLEVACASSDKSTWYVFNGIRWCPKQKTVALPHLINKDIVKRLEEVRIELAQHVHSLSNKIEKQTDEINIKAITSLIQKLYDQRFIQNIVKAATVPFHVEYENFLSWADNNPNLMGCEDCIIEADDKGIIIRDGKPEDYVTMTTKMSLNRIKYHWQHPHVQETMDWIKKIHVDSELRHEFLKECASWLRGRNIEKRVPIWSGDRDNSKSMIIRCLELAFSQYFGKFPTSMITGRRTQSSSATPELARTKGKHTMAIQETDEDVEAFRKGILKELSGADSLFTRGLYDGGGDMLPMFKLLIICNKIPSFIGSDAAIKQRVRIIPFLSTWVDEAPEDPQEQVKQRLFKKDPHFEIRLPTLAPALLWILVQYYPKYIEEGLREPKIVREYTEKYWRDQDFYGEYIKECLEIVETDEGEPDPNVGTTHMELYRHFKIWLKETNPNVKIPPSRDVKAVFEKRLYGFENKKWMGVKIVRDDNYLDI
jgi:phage/plasmid-associated DNA primase